MTPLYAFRIPIKAPSTPNLREHWAPKAKRADKQCTAARASCPRWDRVPLLVIRLVRVAPRQLDGHDNLRAALKSVVDGIAVWLRIDDASPLVQWDYGQEKGEESVRVEVNLP